MHRLYHLHILHYHFALCTFQTHTQAQVHYLALGLLQIFSLSVLRDYRGNSLSYPHTQTNTLTKHTHKHTHTHTHTHTPLSQPLSQASSPGSSCGLGAARDVVACRSELDIPPLACNYTGQR